MDGWLTLGGCPCKPVEGRLQNGLDGVACERAVVSTEDIAGIDNVCPTFSATIGFTMMCLIMSQMFDAAYDGRSQSAPQPLDIESLHVHSIVHLGWTVFI